MRYGVGAHALLPGDSRLGGVLRDGFMPLFAQLPFFRPLMVATMCGLRPGFFGRSLALPRSGGV